MIVEWSPDPPKDEGNESLGSFVDIHITAGLGTVDGNSSDSDDENPSNAGYELLPQGLADEGAEEHDDFDDSDDEMDSQHAVENSFIECDPQPANSNSLASEALTSFEREESRVAATVWKGSKPGEGDAMDPEHAEKVMAAMEGFSLPPSSIPSWASAVPEDEWKTQLVQKIRSKQKNSAGGHSEGSDR